MPPSPESFNTSTVNITPSQHNDDRIRELQAEISQLKEHLFSTSISQGPALGGYDETLDSESDGQRALTPPAPIFNANPPLDISRRPARGTNHNSTLLQLFHEVRYPFSAVPGNACLQAIDPSTPPYPQPSLRRTFQT